MAYRARMRGGVKSLISSLVGTFILLWIGGLIVWEVAVAQLGSCSPFNKGLTILGWKIGNNATAQAATTQLTLQGATVDETCEVSNNILYDVSNSGILVVVGLVAIAAVLLKFIKISKF